MSVLTKLSYKFNISSAKIPASYFVAIYTDSKSLQGKAKIQDGQLNFEAEICHYGTSKLTIKLQ